MSNLQEGDVIEIEEGHSVYADIPEHLRFSNRPNSEDLTHCKITVGDHNLDFAGEYVVYKTAHDGGGRGHGRHDVYPDGHHVYCEKMDDPDTKIDFYQSGSFSAMITDIQPIRKVERIWIDD